MTTLKTTIALALLGSLQTLQAANPTLIKRFMTAAKNGDKQTIMALLDKVPIDSRDDKARTAVHHALLHQQDLIVSTLIAKGADYNIIDSDGNTPLDLLRQLRGDGSQDLLPNDAATALDVEKLIEAAEKSALLFKAVEDGNRTRVEQLLSEGADPITKNKAGLFPFHIAVQRKQPILAAILLKAMRDINGTDDKSWSPLHWAIVGQDWEMVHELLQAGATFRYRPPSRFRSYQDPYDIARRTNSVDQFFTLLAETKNKQIITTLAERATYLGDLTLCAQLIEYFPTYMLQDSFSAYKGLRAAINSGNMQIVELLLASGINKDAYIGRGLMLNYRVRSLPELANLLISYGVEPDEPNPHGRVAIVSIYAAYDKAEALRSARNLLEQGADPNSRDRSGDTPILALANEAVRPANKRYLADFFPAAMQDLLTYEADLNSADAQGHTALMLLAGAKIQQPNPNKQYLIEDYNKRILIHNSAAIISLIRVLLKNGADLQQKDTAGNTALDNARKHKLSTIVAILEHHTALTTATP